jgi:hypothetical protein
LPQNAIFPSIFKLKFWAWNAGDPHFLSFYLEGHIARKFTLKKNKKSMDKKLDTLSTLRRSLRDQKHFCTRLRRDVSQLSINASFFKFPLTEADVKFGLVKFCYIFFILYAINDILLKTVKNNIVVCLCNAFYTNLSLWNATRHHLICVVLSHSTSGGDICYLFSICCLRMK